MVLLIYRLVGWICFFLGDFSQFAPVRDTPLFQRYGASYIKGSTSQSDVLCELGRSLWKQLTHVALLTDQMRVTDAKYLELLGRLRVGKCCLNDYMLLSNRVIGNNNNNISDAISPGTPIIVAGNKLRMEINSLLVKNHSEALSQEVTIVKAIDVCRNSQLNDSEKGEIKNLPNTQTDGLPAELPLFPGMLVYLTKNVSTDIGLTNSTTGVVCQIVGNRTRPECVIVEFSGTIVEPLSGLPPNYVPIFPTKGSFSVTCKTTGKRRAVSRTQIPLEPYYAITAHKSQGQTMRKVIIDLVPQKKGKGDLSSTYVPLSRVRSLDDVLLLRQFDMKVLLQPMNNDLSIMMEDFQKRDICKNI